MNETLDTEYITWLYRQVGNPDLKNPKRTYWSLFRQLYLKEFLWFVPNDDNRVEDGKDLKLEFLRAVDISAYGEEEWATEPGCSFLEMLIALSRRLSFEAEGEAADWFWHIMDNLELRPCNDASQYHTDGVDEILDRVIWRTYDFDGHGGIFPLRSAAEDQREVEIWYQLSSYVIENI